MKQYFMRVFFLFFNCRGLKIFFYFIFIVIPISQYSQNQNQIDSLTKLLPMADDTTKANLYNKISALYQGNANDKIKGYGEKIFEIGKKSNIGKYQAIGLYKLGIYYQLTGKLDSAKVEYAKAIDLAKKYNRLKLEGQIHQNLGVLYADLSDYDKSIREYVLALKIQEKIDDKLSIISLNNNIGVIYLKQKEFYEARNYFIKSIEISVQTKNTYPIGYQYSNLGLVENNLGHFQASDQFYFKAILEFKKNDDISGIVKVYNNLVLSYIELKKIDSALYFNQLLNSVATKNKTLDSKYLSYINYAVLYARFKSKPKLALPYLDSAKNMTEVFSIPEYASTYYQEMAVYEFTNGNKALGYEYLDRCLSLKDSIYSKDNTQLIQDINAKYETEKKDLQIKQQSSELELAAAKSRQKNYFIYGGALVLAIVSLLGFLAFRNFLKVRTANRIIKTQNIKLGQSNIEITEQRNELEQKNTEIMQSILYSKYLQTAILPKKEDIERISKVNFIKYQPKDVVSGDYYWTHNTPNGLSIWATMDCTGHGVPGAMMSMLGISLLNEIVIEKHIYKPSEILNRMRERIIFALNQNTNLELKDGMDGSICVWDKKNNILSYASANSAIWVYRDNQFIELEYNKMPIGKHLVMDPFENFEFQLLKNDWVTSMSDGLVDQFGGPENKKLKYKRVREFLSEKLSMVNHDAILSDLQSFYQDWKGLNEQTDDVTVFGIKI
jgi:serine phosphatase RsbU (regulator of sigma subunit)